MNHRRPFFTIITPVYNRENIVGGTIESVLTQSFGNWEHIIIDDCSTDNTYSVLCNYAIEDKRIIVKKRSRSPRGAQTCRNIGIEAAKGEYLVFLDSDDLLKSFCLEQRMNFIYKNSSFDLAIFPKKPLPSIDKNSILISFLRYKLPIQTTDSLWRKIFISNIGGFNEKLNRFQDVELSIRSLIVKDIAFKCSNDHSADSIYNSSIDFYSGRSQINIFEALIPFVHEIVYLLESNDLSKFKPYLRYYLCSWLIHYHDKNMKFQTLQLIDNFYNKGIISFYLYKALLNIINIGINSFFGKKAGVKFFFYTLFKFK